MFLRHSRSRINIMLGNAWEVKRSKNGDFKNIKQWRIYMQKEIIKEIESNDIFTLNIENWRNGETEPPTEMVAAYNAKGVYIGGLSNLMSICGRFGINPEKANETHSVCSIGFSKRENKWYGWSHRAIFGFGVGNITKEGDCQTTSGWTDEYLKEHPEELDKLIPVGFECKTLDDCKRVAIAFAESVS